MKPQPVRSKPEAAGMLYLTFTCVAARLSDANEKQTKFRFGKIESEFCGWGRGGRLKHPGSPKRCVESQPIGRLVNLPPVQK